MSRIVQIQTNFSVGEIDPLLRARIDLKQYFSALETAENVIIQPQGGVKRREGMRYATTLDSGAANVSGLFRLSLTLMTAICSPLLLANCMCSVTRHW